ARDFRARAVVGGRALQRIVAQRRRGADAVEQPAVLVVDGLRALVDPVRRALDAEIALDHGLAAAASGEREEQGGCTEELEGWMLRADLHGGSPPDRRQQG